MKKAFLLLQALAVLLCTVPTLDAQIMLQPTYSRRSSLAFDQDTASSDIAGLGGLYGGPDESSHDGSRVQFHVQGHKGPKSYRFGYDTGHGKHRHFRYEERDPHGMVHGRYGFRDKHGHMRVFHYTAHPHHGYRANEASPHQYSHYRV